MGVSFHLTLLVNATRPKIHAPGAGFIHGICRTLASFDCRLQNRISKRFGINQQSHMKVDTFGKPDLHTLLAMKQR